jgi:hypothetical protein
MVSSPGPNLLSGPTGLVPCVCPPPFFQMSEFCLKGRNPGLVHVSIRCVRSPYYEYHGRGYAVLPGVEIRCHARSGFTVNTELLSPKRLQRVYWLPVVNPVCLLFLTPLVEIPHIKTVAVFSRRIVNASRLLLPQHVAPRELLGRRTADRIADRVDAWPKDSCLSRMAA